VANPVHIARVIAAIQGETQEGLGFNMGAYIGAASEGIIGDALGRDCGTVACIAGHAYLLATGNTVEEGIQADSDDIDRIAADYLGIDMCQAATLFYDLPPDVTLCSVSAEDAIATLDRLARTGDVVWNIEELEAA